MRLMGPVPPAAVVEGPEGGARVVFEGLAVVPLTVAVAVDVVVEVAGAALVGLRALGEVPVRDQYFSICLVIMTL